MIGKTIVIPARIGSTRFPAKPLAEINGKPLICWVVESALAMQLGEVIVATDDDRIVDAVDHYDVRAVMTSNHHTSGTSRLLEVADLLGFEDEHILVNLQGDEPLVPPEVVTELVSFLESSKRFSVATALTPIVNERDFTDLNVVKGVYCKSGRVAYFSRSPVPCCREYNLFGHKHIGLYAYRKKALAEFCSFGESKLEMAESLEQLRFIDNDIDIGAIITDQNLHRGVDVPSDIKYYEKLLLK